MNRYQVLAIVFAVSLAGGLIWSADHYNGKYQEARRQVEEQKNTLVQQSGLITTLQTQDVQNRALMAAQQQQEQQLRQQSDTYQRKYREAIKNDACAAKRMPDAVIELLRGTATHTASTDRPASP